MYSMFVFEKGECRAVAARSLRHPHAQTTSAFESHRHLGCLNWQPLRWQVKEKRGLLMPYISILCSPLVDLFTYCCQDSTNLAVPAVVSKGDDCPHWNRLRVQANGGLTRREEADQTDDRKEGMVGLRAFGPDGKFSNSPPSLIGYVSHESPRGSGTSYEASPITGGRKMLRLRGEASCPLGTAFV